MIIRCVGRTAVFTDWGWKSVKHWRRQRKGRVDLGLNDHSDEKSIARSLQKGGMIGSQKVGNRPEPGTWLGVELELLDVQDKEDK